MELWDLGTSKPLPVKALYAVRIVLLIAPALGMVYFFTRAALFPVGAVPLVYLVVHGWLATIYRGATPSRRSWPRRWVFSSGTCYSPCTGRMRFLGTSGCSTRERY